MKLSKNFDSKEFPEDPREYCEPEIIEKLQAQRDYMGAEIYPSLHPGGTARLYSFGMSKREYIGSYKKRPSMHCVLSDKKSTAVDWFSELCHFQTLCSVLKSGLWDGVGIYFDTICNDGNPDVMFHTDIGRGYNLFWLRVDGVYHYETEGELFYNLLAQKLVEFRK